MAHRSDPAGTVELGLAKGAKMVIPGHGACMVGDRLLGRLYSGQRVWSRSGYPGQRVSISVVNHPVPAAHFHNGILFV